MQSVVITGAAGNLGSKLVQAFARATWCGRVLAVDRPAAVASGRLSHIDKVDPVALDLGTASPDRLATLLAGVDAVVHFAVVNPLPDATWTEAADSFGMTSRLLLAARDSGVRRFVFASSNHAVGQLKEASAAMAPGTLAVDRVAPGTRWETLDGVIDGYAYGASKVFAERLCLAAARRGGLSTVSVRIGWCQAGENDPQTINAGGNPQISNSGGESRSGDADLRWFRNMWLSNRDFESLFERAVQADATPWPAPGVVVNGVSANEGMPWEIEAARSLLGYRPIDDVWAHF